MKKKKLKKYLIGIEDFDIDPYDEFVVEAKNKTEAKNLARMKMFSDDYIGWEIVDIEEIKDE